MGGRSHATPVFSAGTFVGRALAGDCGSAESCEESAADRRAGRRGGGRPEWPWITWDTDHEKVGLNPYRKASLYTHPISGTVAGREYTSFRIDYAEMYLGATRVSYHTAVVVLGLDPSLPSVDFVSTQGHWPPSKSARTGRTGRGGGAHRASAGPAARGIAARCAFDSRAPAASTAHTDHHDSPFI